MADLLTDLLAAVRERVDAHNRAAPLEHRMTETLPMTPMPKGVARWRKEGYPAGYIEIRHADAFESYAIDLTVVANATTPQEDLPPVIITKLQSPDRLEPYVVGGQGFASLAEAVGRSLDAFFARIR